MKKFLVILMMLTFAAGAFAQDVAKTGPEFKYSVWANAFAITENTATKDTTKDYSAIRVRPMFSMGNENVSVVTRLEIDQYYGKGGTNTAPVGGNGSASNSGYADSDTDQIAVEVKWAYINVKDFFIPGLTATAGLAPFVYSVGYNNDMPQFNLVYDAGMVKVDLAYVKVEEMDLTTENAGVKDEDDVQMYSAKLPIKIGDLTITPAVLYAAGEKNRNLGTLSGALIPTDADLALFGNDGEYTKTEPSISLALTSGDFSLNADFVYIMGESKTYSVDYAAYAAYVNAGFKASDALKISAFGLYTTGQDDSSDLTSFQALCGDEVEVGPMFIINDNGNINQVGVSNEYDAKATEGLTVFGLAAELKMDKFTALAQAAYAMTNEDVYVEDTDLGMEFDLRLSYEVAPKTSFWVEGAYLMAGKYIEAKEAGNEQDITYYAAGLMTSI